MKKTKGKIKKGFLDGQVLSPRHLFKPQYLENSFLDSHASK